MTNKKDNQWRCQAKKAMYEIETGRLAAATLGGRGTQAAMDDAARKFSPGGRAGRMKAAISRKRSHLAPVQVLDQLG
jgi:hypothetical protein